MRTLIIVVALAYADHILAAEPAQTSKATAAEASTDANTSSNAPSRKAPADTAKKLSGATKKAVAALPTSRAELKALLSPELSQNYSLCYWADDGCLWCSDDGRDWYRARCITAQHALCCYGPCHCNTGGLSCCEGKCDQATGNCP